MWHTELANLLVFDH